MGDPIPAGAGMDVLVRRLMLLESRLELLESPSGTQRAQTARSTPTLDFRNSRQAGFGIDGSWNTYAAVDIPVPEARNYARVVGIGSAAVTDMTSGGVTTSAARVVIAGDVGAEFPASKDAAATRVINVLAPVHVATVPVQPGGIVTVQIQLKALNPSAFPANGTNFAAIAPLVAFTYQEGTT